MRGETMSAEAVKYLTDLVAMDDGENASPTVYAEVVAFLVAQGGTS
jgi:hypothetical protein